MEIRPQPGPQSQFLATPADIAVYGGAAGGGKTFALLLEFLRHVGNPGFNAVIFRRTAEQIRMSGGLWDEASRMYPGVGGRGRDERLDWRFPSGATIVFDSLQYEKDKLSFQGAQICALGFDELTHFSEGQFFYLLSRNRSTCGVRPYVRATTNPDSGSWVKRFLAPWLSREFDSPAASGELRWFVRDGGSVTWVREGTPDAKSVTFIRASVFDNPALLSRDPGYLANLRSLPLVDRRRLLDGDWEADEGGAFFRPEWFRFGQSRPDSALRVRFWDLAGSEVRAGRDPDYTVGVLLSRDSAGEFCVEDVKRVRERPLGVRRLVLATALEDGDSVSVRMEQEPGSAGVAVIEDYARALAGFDFAGVRSSGGKVERAKPFSAMCEAGQVRLLKKPWNAAYLEELALFPSREAHDDQVDASSGAFREIVKRRAIELSFS
jgi:predicted phage terminase large subunit-like protein